MTAAHCEAHSWLLMLALTFAPCAYGVSLLSTGATIPLAQMVVVTSCNLRWWCLYMYICAVRHAV